MPEEITVRYHWTLEEVTTASRWHFRQAARRQFVRVLCWMLAAACVGAAVITYLHTGNPYLAGWCLVGTVYFLFLLTLRRRIVLWQMRRNYAKSTSRDAEINWQITEARLAMRFAHGTAELSWTAFNKAVLTPDGWLLYPQPLLFHWLPRHAFASEDEFTAVLEMVRRKIPAFREIR